MPSLVDRIYEIEAHHGSHGDREHWALDVFETFLGLSVHKGTRAEVYLGPGGGRADVIVQEDVVIEVKKNLEDEAEDAERQLTTYFRAKRSLNIGIATDGVRWRFFVRVRGEPRPYHFMTLSADSTDAQFKESLLKSLQVFRKSKPEPVDAQELCDTLKLDTPTFRFSTRLLEEASSHSPRFRIERRAWIGEFSRVYPGFDEICRNMGDKSVELGYNRFYIRHTYLVVIARLLAAMRVFNAAQLARMVEANPEELLDGTSLESNGVYVSDRDDYFAWVGKPSEELRTFVKELFLSLSRYDFSSVDEDVFRLLYEEIIDADTRHSIGEFYTPRWLAQFIASRTIRSGEDVVLDPACGSGTFLVEAVRQRAALRSKSRSLSTSDLSDLVDQTWGFDINPLAKILSRVNLYLAISRLAKLNKTGTPGVFRPHVYTADSLSRIRSSFHRSRLEGSSGYFVTLAQRWAPVPSSVSSLEDAIKVGQALSKVCDAYVGSREGGKTHSQALSEALEQSPNAFRSSIEDIVNKLKTELEDGDGIWGLVYRNKVVPLFSRRFDSVVGNPPWLVFREMDDGMKDIANFVIEEHGIRPKPNVKSHFDLAIAFTIAASSYLNPGGRLGFVLPRSLVAGLQHLPFLEVTSSGKHSLRLDEIDDLQGVDPPPFPHGVPCVAAFFHVAG